MKKTFTTAFTVMLIATAFISCSIEKPIQQSPADNNSTFTVDYLFEHDGVKVYRFKDYDRYVYFTSPTGLTTSVKSDSIKSVIRTIHMPGVEKPE